MTTKGDGEDKSPMWFKIDHNTTKVLQTLAALGAITVMIGNWVKSYYAVKHSDDPPFSSAKLSKYAIDPETQASRFVTMWFDVVKSRKCYVVGEAPVQVEMPESASTVMTEPIMRLNVSKLPQKLIIRFGVPYKFVDRADVTIMPIYDCGKYNVPYQFGPYHIEYKGEK